MAASPPGEPDTAAIPPGTPDNPLPLPVVLFMVGNPDTGSEELIAFEFGFRTQLTDGIFADISAFHNHYDDLTTLEADDWLIDTWSDSTYCAVPYHLEGKMHGYIYGAELMADWRVLNWWRLQAGYAYLQVQLSTDEDSDDIWSEAWEDESPHHQFSLRSSTDLTRELGLDVWTRYVGNSLNTDSYISISARLGWKLRRNLEVSIVGQNLLDNHHPEFIPDFYDAWPTEVERSVYGKVSWHF